MADRDIEAVADVVGRTPTEVEILVAARERHDATGCRCDRRYIMSCQRMAAAILEVGRPHRRVEHSDGYPDEPENAIGAGDY